MYIKIKLVHTIVTDGLLHWNARDTQDDFEDDQNNFNELDQHEWSEYTNISKNMNMFKEHVKYTTLQSSVQWLSALIRIINDNYEI